MLGHLAGKLQIPYPPKIELWSLSAVLVLLFVNLSLLAAKSKRIEFSYGVKQGKGEKRNSDLDSEKRMVFCENFNAPTTCKVKVHIACDFHLNKCHNLGVVA